jgi:hypothetical protein
MNYCNFESCKKTRNNKPKGDGGGGRKCLIRVRSPDILSHWLQKCCTITDLGNIDFNLTHTFFLFEPYSGSRDIVVGIATG